MSDSFVTIVNFSSHEVLSIKKSTRIFDLSKEAKENWKKFLERVKNNRDINAIICNYIKHHVGLYYGIMPSFFNIPGYKFKNVEVFISNDLINNIQIKECLENFGIKTFIIDDNIVL